MDDGNVAESVSRVLELAPGLCTVDTSRETMLGRLPSTSPVAPVDHQGITFGRHTREIRARYDPFGDRPGHAIQPICPLGRKVAKRQGDKKVGAGIRNG